MKRIISTDAAPKSIANYSQAIEANGFLFISGQIAIDPASNKLIDGDITAQTSQVLKNADAILTAAGYTKNDVVKVTCLLSDMNHYAAMNVVYLGYFGSEPPARAAYATAGLPMGGLVEIEIIATKQ
ncbi:MAG: Rid family detoxifying hydrolase [Bacteroidota bacterium]